MFIYTERTFLYQPKIFFGSLSFKKYQKVVKTSQLHFIAEITSIPHVSLMYGFYQITYITVRILFP